MNARQVHDVIQYHPGVCHVFPDEEKLVFADRIIDETVTEFCFTRAAVLMQNPACGSQKTFPAAFPSLVREIRVFDVKGTVQGIKPANREELAWKRGWKCLLA